VGNDLIDRRLDDLVIENEVWLRVGPCNLVVLSIDSLCTVTKGVSSVIRPEERLCMNELIVFQIRAQHGLTLVAPVLQDSQESIAHLAVRRAEVERLDTKDLDHRLLHEPQLVVGLVPRESAHVGMRVAVTSDSPTGSIRSLKLVGVVVDAAPVVTVHEEGTLAPSEVGDDLGLPLVRTICISCQQGKKYGTINSRC
jgi:hypothetical protein